MCEFQVLESMSLSESVRPVFVVDAVMTVSKSGGTRSLLIVQRIRARRYVSRSFEEPEKSAKAKIRKA